MRRALKWAGMGLGVLVGLAAVAAVALSVVGGARLKRTRAVRAEVIPIPTDSAALARGRHVTSFFCTGCHGDDLTGTPMLESRALGAVHAANITGLGGARTDADLVRAIRHAVAPDGRQLAIMPADALIHLSREDLGAVIAYLKTLARVGDPRPAPRLTLLGRLLLGAGLFGDVFPAEYVDHGAPFPPMPELGANIATGEYLSRFCYGCHGPDLGGGTAPDPASPPAPSLAGVRDWSEAAFLTFTRTGRTPSGRQMNPAFMPWAFFGKLDPEERLALYRYLRSRPAAPAPE